MLPWVSRTCPPLVGPALLASSVDDLSPVCNNARHSLCAGRLKFIGCNNGALF